MHRFKVTIEFTVRPDLCTVVRADNIWEATDKVSTTYEIDNEQILKFFVERV